MNKPRPLPTKLNAIRSALLRAGALLALLALVFAITEPLGGGSASADEGPYIAQAVVIPIDSEDSGLSAGDKIAFQFLVAGVGPGAEVQPIVRWRDSALRLYVTELLCGMTLHRDAWLYCEWRIPTNLRAHDGTSGASWFELGIKTKYWRTSSETEGSKASLFHRLLGISKAKATPPIIIAAYAVGFIRVTVFLAPKASTVVPRFRRMFTGLPRGWKSWTISRQGRYAEGVAKSMLEDCALDVLDSNVRYKGTDGRQIAEADHLVDIGGKTAHGEVRGQSNSALWQIKDKLTKSEKARSQSGAKYFLWGAYPDTNTQDNIGKIRTRLRSAMKSKKHGFTRAYLMDMATGCPVQVWP